MAYEVDLASNSAPFSCFELYFIINESTKQPDLKKSGVKLVVKCHWQTTSAVVLVSNVKDTPLPGISKEMNCFQI